MVVGHLIALLAIATAASARGAVGFSVFASPGALFGTWVFFAYALVIQTLWWLPYYAWFLFVSASSLRGKPVDLGRFPPVIVGLVELILSHTSHVFQFFGSHLAMSPIFNGWPVAEFQRQCNPIGHAIRRKRQPAVFRCRLGQQFLAMPSMWIGVGIGLVLLALAVIARRYSATA